VVSFLNQFLDLLGSERRKVPFFVLLFLIASMLDLLGLSLIGPYVSLVVDPAAAESLLATMPINLRLPQEYQPLLIVLGLALFAVFAIKAAVTIGIHWVIIRFSQGQQLRLRTYLMQAYQALSYTDYLRRNSSEYIYNIQVLTTQFSDVVRILLRATSDGVVAVVIVCLLAWTNAPALILLVTLLGTVVIGYDRLFRKNMTHYGHQFNTVNTQMVQGIHEGVEGFKEIRVLGCQGYFLKKVQDNARQASHYQARQLMTQQAPWYLLEWVMVSFVVLLVLGAPFVGKDIATLLPTLGIFGVAAMRLISLANLIATSLIQLRFAHDHISRLSNDLIDLKQAQGLSLGKDKERISSSAVGKVLPEKFHTLVINDLTYRYPNAKVDALKGINMRIHAGESVGLVGPSGSGKTTLVDVLLGLLEPKRECITFNDRPLKEALSDWHSQSAYLPQEVFLIDDTLGRNVALGVEDALIDEGRLYNALSRARLDEVVKQLSYGIDTRLGEHGARLSGGQRQRVALARAFYHQRRVLVMDESTSALDYETEKEIVEEIKQLKGEITLIVIAHRLTTVEQCDHIFQLERGRLIKQGRPGEVLNSVE
jgi:ATP-binding cassette, subfamily B, bacterial PglK